MSRVRRDRGRCATLGPTCGRDDAVPVAPIGMIALASARLQQGSVRVNLARPAPRGPHAPVRTARSDCHRAVTRRSCVAAVPPRPADAAAQHAESRRRQGRHLPQRAPSTPRPPTSRSRAAYMVVKGGKIASSSVPASRCRTSRNRCRGDRPRRRGDHPRPRGHALAHRRVEPAGRARELRRQRDRAARCSRACGPSTRSTRTTPAFAWRLAGGVTTANIMPGSGNVIGGQTLYVKLRGRTRRGDAHHRARRRTAPRSSAA